MGFSPEGFWAQVPPSSFARTIKAPWSERSEPQPPPRCCAASKGNAEYFAVNFTPICHLSLCSEPISMTRSFSEKEERRAARRWRHLNNCRFLHRQGQSGWQVLAARSTAWGEVMRGGAWGLGQKQDTEGEETSCKFFTSLMDCIFLVKKWSSW